MRDLIKCPTCRNERLKRAVEVISDVRSMYMACPKCPPDPILDKNLQLRNLPLSLKRCNHCEKAPLDTVMLDALHILKDFGLRDETDNLRSVGSPLIVIGYPIPYPPRLSSKSLIIMSERIGKDAAIFMVKHIPEIKGVILNRGSAGLRNLKDIPQKNILLAGCDMRADIAQSLFGELVIYKNQSRIHIEFARQTAPKMQIIEHLFFRKKAAEVVDGLCGPGTLGLMCALAGAKHVVLNDAWRPAVENAMLNLEINKEILGIEDIEYPEVLQEQVGSYPVLACNAHGSCEIEIYHGDLAKLFSRIKPAETCIIDHFPGADTKELKAACRPCSEVLII